MPDINNFSNSNFDNGITVQKGPPLADIAVDPKKPSLTDVMTEWGGTGTVIVGGILSNADYNYDLTGTQRVDIYDQMRKGDATVRAALLAVKLPILSANWYIKPASEDEADIKVADFIEEQLFHNMELTWTEWLRHCLNFLDYGSMVFEKVYKVIDTGEYQGMIGWEKFAPRLTKTIYRWRMPDNVTKGITQILPTGGIRGIPEWKTLMFINEQEGENYEGISILRSAYKSWYMKDALYKIDGIATERQGLGIPYVKIPPNATDQDRAKVNELMRNLRANEMANIEVPVGWEIGFLDMHANTIKNGHEMILHHDRQITKSVLAQFLELGSSGGSGSRALSSDHSELFYLSLQYVAKIVQDILNNKAVRELVDLNFPVKKYPTLEVSDIEQIDVDKLADSLQKFTSAGVITTTPAIEQYVRQAMNLPEETPEEIEEHRQKKMQEEIEKQKQISEAGGDGGFGGGGGKGDDKDKKKQKQSNGKLSAEEMAVLENRMFGKFYQASEAASNSIRTLRSEVDTILHERNVTGY